MSLPGRPRFSIDAPNRFDASGRALFVHVLFDYNQVITPTHQPQKGRLFDELQARERTHPMIFELPELPYAMDALAPHLSARTLEFHYERHHRGYLEKLRGLIEGTPDEDLELTELVTQATGAVFNNAAQVWNHTFYWQSMAPDGGGEPSGRLGEGLARAFGSIAAFRKEFTDRAVGLFGSGYLWLTYDPADERIALEPMKDADNPLLADRVPLLAMDVWEHAYYLDYQNARNRYAEAFVSHLANWRFAERNLESAA